MFPLFFPLHLSLSLLRSLSQQISEWGEEGGGSLYHWRSGLTYSTSCLITGPWGDFLPSMNQPEKKFRCSISLGDKGNVSCVRECVITATRLCYNSHHCRHPRRERVWIREREKLCWAPTIPGFWIYSPIALWSPHWVPARPLHLGWRLRFEEDWEAG